MGVPRPAWGTLNRRDRERAALVVKQQYHVGAELVSIRLVSWPHIYRATVVCSYAIRSDFALNFMLNQRQAMKAGVYTRLSRRITRSG